MHELITAVGAMIILSLFITQFAANENLYLETVEIEQIIEGFQEEEYSEAEIPEKMEELIGKLDAAPNTRADRTKDGLSITIDRVIGPAAALGIRDNSIRINKRIEFRVKEDTNEESVDNGGITDIDGTSEQIPDGHEPDGAVNDLDNQEEEMSDEENEN